MGPTWAYAFVTAGLVTLAGTPLLRKLAVATEFVDHPVAAHKSHKRPTPYLGGIGLIMAVLMGLLFADRLTTQVTVIALGGSLIGCLGLLDDHRSVGPLVRFLVELAVAAVAVGAGLRIHATDVAGIDAALTLVWIVGVTNAVNLLDNMDGLAAGVSAAAGTAIFALAVLGEQFVTATVAAGLVGACIGFLAYNKRPATIFMGDTGSLFLGFVLAVTAIGVSPALTPPVSFAVPLLLLALPVLDTATVTLARLRRGRSVSLGGKDHLSHRLVARGLSPGAAVGVLVAVEAAVGLAAVTAGREILPLPVALAGAVAVVAALAAATVPAKVYTEPVIGLPRRLRQVAAAGIFGVVLLATPAAVSLARAHQPGMKGARQAQAAMVALEAGDANRAETLFAEAATRLGQARSILGGRLNSLGLLLPGLRANLATTRALVSAGYEVSSSGSEVSALIHARSFTGGDGPAIIAASTRLAPALAQSATLLERSAATLAGYDRPYVWASIAAHVRRLRASFDAASAQASTAAEVSRLVPALIGGPAPRRYFLAVQDNAELRGAGGVIRLWGEISAEGGRMQLTRLGTVDELNDAGTTRVLEGPLDFVERYRHFDPAHTWENINVSPDFSVTGEVISRLYPQSGGRQVDGVVAVDLRGLAALLDLAGPIRVDGWPEAVTAANLVDVVVREAAVRVPDPAEREAFLNRLYRRTVESFLAADLGSPSRLAAALGPAVQGGHLLLYASQAEEEALFRRLGAAGQIQRTVGDSLLVVNQNLSATPVDAHLRRSIRYDLRLDPGREPAAVTGKVEVTLANEAATENRTETTVYSPFGLATPAAGIQSASELGRRAHSTIAAIPAHQSRTVSFDLAGHLELASDHWYHLRVSHQAVLVPDRTEISLSVPSGWQIAEVRGGSDVVDGRRAQITVSRNDDVVSVRLERTAWSRLWAHVGD